MGPGLHALSDYSVDMVNYVITPNGSDTTDHALIGELAAGKHMFASTNPSLFPDSYTHAAFTSEAHLGRIAIPRQHLSELHAEFSMQRALANRKIQNIKDKIAKLQLQLPIDQAHVPARDSSDKLDHYYLKHDRGAARDKLAKVLSKIRCGDLLQEGSSTTDESSWKEFTACKHYMKLYSKRLEEELAARKAKRNAETKKAPRHPSSLPPEVLGNASARVATAKRVHAVRVNLNGMSEAEINLLKKDFEKELRADFLFGIGCDNQLNQENVLWLFDSGASFHYMPACFEERLEEKKYINSTVKVANSQFVRVKCEGYLKLASGHRILVRIVENLSVVLISVGLLEKTFKDWSFDHMNGWMSVSQRGSCECKDGSTVTTVENFRRLAMRLRNNLYVTDALAVGNMLQYIYDIENGNATEDYTKVPEPVFASMAQGYMNMVDIKAASELEWLHRVFLHRSDIASWYRNKSFVNFPRTSRRRKGCDCGACAKAKAHIKRGWILKESLKQAPSRPCQHWTVDWAPDITPKSAGNSQIAIITDAYGPRCFPIAAARRKMIRETMILLYLDIKLNIHKIPQHILPRDENNDFKIETVTVDGDPTMARLGEEDSDNFAKFLLHFFGALLIIITAGAHFLLGAGERQVGLVKTYIRVCMFSCTLKLKYWSYAVTYIRFVLYYIPSSGNPDGLSPCAMWECRSVDFDAELRGILQVFGAPGVFTLMEDQVKAQRNSLWNVKGGLCFYLHPSTTRKGAVAVLIQGKVVQVLAGGTFWDNRATHRFRVPIPFEDDMHKDKVKLFPVKDPRLSDDVLPSPTKSILIDSSTTTSSTSASPTRVATKEDALVQESKEIKDDQGRTILIRNSDGTFKLQPYTVHKKDLEAAGVNIDKVIKVPLLSSPSGSTDVLPSKSQVRGYDSARSDVNTSTTTTTVTCTSTETVVTTNSSSTETNPFQLQQAFNDDMVKRPKEKLRNYQDVFFPDTKTLVSNAARKKFFSFEYTHARQLIGRIGAKNFNHPVSGKLMPFFFVVTRTTNPANDSKSCFTFYPPQQGDEESDAEAVSCATVRAGCKLFERLVKNGAVDDELMKTLKQLSSKSISDHVRKYQMLKDMDSTAAAIEAVIQAAKDDGQILQDDYLLQLAEDLQPGIERNRVERNEFHHTGFTAEQANYYGMSLIQTVSNSNDFISASAVISDRDHPLFQPKNYGDAITLKNYPYTWGNKPPNRFATEGGAIYRECMRHARFNACQIKSRKDIPTKLDPVSGRQVYAVRVYRMFWVLKVKPKEIPARQRKARPCAIGNNHGASIEMRYSAACADWMFKYVMAIGTYAHLSMFISFDLFSSFLQVKYANEKFHKWCEPPEDWVDGEGKPVGKDKVLLYTSCLYGFFDSSKHLFVYLYDILIDYGFSSNAYGNACLTYIDVEKDIVITLCIYVDDGTIQAADLYSGYYVICVLRSRGVCLEAEVYPRHFIGYRRTYYRDTMNQNRIATALDIDEYKDKLLVKYARWRGQKRVLPSNHMISDREFERQTREWSKPIDPDKVKFARVFTGELMYGASKMMVAEASTVNLLARFQAKPIPLWFEFAQHLIQYIDGDIGKRRCIMFFPAKKESPLYPLVCGFSDASWKLTLLNRSLLGTAIQVGWDDQWATIRYGCSLTKVSGLSSTDTETYAASAVVTQLLLARNFGLHMGVATPYVPACDNAGTKRNAATGNKATLGYANYKLEHIYDSINDGLLENFEKIDGRANPADVTTKRSGNSKDVNWKIDKLLPCRDAAFHSRFKEFSADEVGHTLLMNDIDKICQDKFPELGTPPRRPEFLQKYGEEPFLEDDYDEEQEELRLAKLSRRRKRKRQWH